MTSSSPRPWQGPAGLGAIAASIGCFLLTALLGPSVMQPALPGLPGQPPFSLDVHPSPYLVIGLVVAGILAGGGGLALCLTAVARGWRCRPMPLVVAGVLVAGAFAFLPPIGSGDHLNYAAYGRMVATGHDPYATRAVDLPGDPVIDAVEEWRRAPSVYGPIATAQEAFASRIGGESMRLTVFVMSLINSLAFVLTAAVLYWTSGTRERRLRTALMWTFNPLLLFHLVAGSHNDTLAIAPMVAALAVFTGRRREGSDKASRAPWTRSLAAGALVGAAMAIKLPAGLVGGGPAWVLLARWRRTRERAVLWRLAALFGGAGAVAVVTFALAGPHAFDQVARAANSVSLATPWHLVDLLLGRGGHRTFIKIGFVVLLLVLLWLLARALPRDGEPGVAGGERDEARRIAAALVLAWLFAAPYELPWYDGFAWAALALLAWSRFDWLLLAHTTAMSLAYLPARDPKLIGLPGNLEWLVTVVRGFVIPVLTTAILIALILECRRRRDPVPAPVRSPRASAESRG
ncbi:polyprenol phosphomannose-dependent alpha 1,6 mannosyltransferase MptB [Actinomadura sp. 9N407]|uniref:polyprenol phosphomannose-dependent alpha 1,6 mannosyltransferase MptB n=1 Tax=Actinomadura sp. 9N407 TaxID=3375154 RepID=UPI0037B823A8